MEGLVKIALNAMAARGLAEKAGLVPAGNWKWGLRQLRDGRGDLLQGRDLAQAKEGLGKLPNNARQQIQSASRKAGGKEVHGNLFPNDNKLTNLVTGQHDSVSPVLGPTDPAFKNIKTDVHTHPRVPALQYNTPEAATKQINGVLRGASENGELNSRQDYWNAVKEQRGVFSEMNRVGQKNHELVSPSGYTNTPHKAPKEAVNLGRFSTHGDYRAFLAGSKTNPNVNYNIVDPHYGNEGVHKIRPDFLRSVYFKNQGEYN